MKFLGIIPARGGSKGIPKKNIKLLKGRPLISYTIEAAKKSKIQDIVVSTDDEQIASIARDHGVQVVMRPEELAADDTPTLPVLQHVLSLTNMECDAVVTLQPTSPLRTNHHINEAIDLFIKNQHADSLVSVVRVPHQYAPSSQMKINDEGFLVPWISQKGQILRRQDKETTYARNGAAIYITRIEALNSFVFGGNILPYFMDKLDSIDVDDEEDFSLAEKLI